MPDSSPPPAAPAAPILPDADVLVAPAGDDVTAQARGAGERANFWLIVVRFLVSLAALGALLARQGLHWPRNPEARVAGATFLAALVLSLAYLIALWLLQALRVAALRRPFAFLQIALDVLLVSVLVLPKGGVESRYTIFYIAPVLAGAIVFGSRGALFFAALATILLSCASLAAALLPAAWRPVWIVEPNLSALEVIAQHLTTALGFFLVAILSGSLAQRLARARILSHEILESIGQGLLIIDEAGRLLYANPEARRLLGREELRLEFPLAEAFFGEELAAVRSALAAPGALALELELAGADGVRRPLRLAVHPIRTRRRAAQRIVVLTDLSLQRRVEEAQRAAERHAAVSEMSLSIAHEIRNPLASIRGAVQEIRRQLAGPEAAAAAELMGIVLSESDRLDRIVAEFLRFARMRSPRRVRCDLPRLVEEARRLLEQNPAARGVALELDLPAGLACRADGEQLQQVLLNLGLNALAALDGRGRLTLRGRPCDRAEFTRLGLAATGSEPPAPHESAPGVLLEVADDGPGMDEEVRRRAFDPFLPPRPGGTGLGLSVVARIIRAHGGEVVLDSAPGVGTTARVWLPLR